MISLVRPYIAPKEEMMPEIERVLYSGYIAMGEEVKTFESNMAAFIDNSNIVALNSGTAALHIALTLLDVGPNDEVISTAMTAEPTNTTIALTGAKIIWADVDYNTGLIDPVSIESNITEKTKAIIVVHYAGMVCDMDRINEISQKYDIPVIEDAAHALGSKYNKKYIGSNSRFTCFSFQAIKHMTTVDGGALAISGNVIERDFNEAQKLRWFGLDKNKTRLENNIQKAGFKYGMNNINAAIGNIQIKYIKNIISRHISNGKFYDAALSNIDGITLIPYSQNTEPSFWLYTAKVENRASFIKMMQAQGIEVSPLHHRSDTHSVFSRSKTELKNLDKWYSEFIHIPCGWWVSDEDREFIVDCIKKGW